MKEHDLNMYEVAARIIKESDLALLVTDDEEREIWLPKSQIEYEGEMVLIPTWLAITEGFF